MADINSKEATKLVSLVELMFFAYRDFVADPDHLLEGMGMGRAHHRVVHFIGRNPGLTVARLLDILQITKQSLARVLKELIDGGFVYQKEGEEDRRQRHLHLTPSGDELRARLMSPQLKRFKRALAETGMDSQQFAAMLLHLADPTSQPLAQFLSGSRHD